MQTTERIMNTIFKTRIFYGKIILKNVDGKLRICANGTDADIDAEIQETVSMKTLHVVTVTPDNYPVCDAFVSNTSGIRFEWERGRITRLIQLRESACVDIIIEVNKE